MQLKSQLTLHQQQRIYYFILLIVKPTKSDLIYIQEWTLSHLNLTILLVIEIDFQYKMQTSLLVILVKQFLEIEDKETPKCMLQSVKTLLVILEKQTQSLTLASFQKELNIITSNKPSDIHILILNMFSQYSFIFMFLQHLFGKLVLQLLVLFDRFF